MDRRNDRGLNAATARSYFINPAAVSARVMTLPTSMLLRSGVRGGLAGRTNVVRGHSVAARSGDCRDAVAADGMTGAGFGAGLATLFASCFTTSFGWLTRSVRPKKFAM